MGCRDARACDAWHLLARLFFKQRAHLPTVGAELDLSPAQIHVLRTLEPARPMPMGRLAERLACDASNITGLVDRLESRGFVRRRPSSSDRRVKVLEITASGARARAMLMERMAPPAVFERLSVREQQMLVEMLGRLLD